MLHAVSRAEIMLTQAQVVDAVAEPVARIVHVVRSALEHTQPEIAADVIDAGITMTGGGSLLREISTVIEMKPGYRSGSPNRRSIALRWVRTDTSRIRPIAGPYWRFSFK